MGLLLLLAPANRSLISSRKADQAEGSLALLTALAPYQVDEEIIRAYRSQHGTDARLVGVVAWASFAAACRIASWLQAPTQGEEVRQA